MADISSYQHKFRATSKSVKPDNSGKVRKRNRAAVSCLQCRNKKSKCDREQPCGSCKVHGTTCTYGKSDVKRPSKISPQDRLNHLEDLLLEMIQAKDQNNVQLPVGRTPSQLASPEDSASSIEISTGSPGSGQALRGSYRQSETEESYVGPTHWQAILETVCSITARSGDSYCLQRGRYTVLKASWKRRKALAISGQVPATRKLFRVRASSIHSVLQVWPISCAPCRIDR